MIWDLPKHRTPRLGEFMLSTARGLSRSDTGRIITEIKSRMLSEPDLYKRQCWADVGIELNRLFMNL